MLLLAGRGSEEESIHVIIIQHEGSAVQPFYFGYAAVALFIIISREESSATRRS